MGWIRRAIEWVRGDRDAALREELEAHRAFAQDELERAGLTPAEAEIESRRRLGNVTLAREDSRDVWIARWLDQLRQHLRYGIRGLRREPAFVLTAIITLAFGSAASITVFSVVDAEVWRPLPYPDAGRLVAVASHRSATNKEADGIAIDELQDWRRTATDFFGLAAVGPAGSRTAQLDRAESIYVGEVTANYFTTLGRTAIAGRVFMADDGRGAGVAVLTDRGWRRRFNRDPSSVGRSFMLDGRSVTIVGLLGPDASMGPEPDMYLPIDERTSTALFVNMIGRLTKDGTINAVTSQLQAAIDRRAVLEPGRQGHVAAVDDLSTSYRRTDQRPLYFFLGAALLVLLLTIVNVSGLLVSRAMRRTPEFALRGALGGGAGALAAQTMVEGALVAAPGCAIGLMLAFLAVGALESVVPAEFLWRGTNIALDVRAAVFTFAVASLTAVALTFVPLGIVRRSGTRTAMGSGNRVGDAPHTTRIRRFLLVGQLTMTVILLAGAGMFVKSFTALTTVPLGFDPANAFTLRVTLSGPSYSTPAAIRDYIDTATERLRAVAGVRFVAPATSSPLNSGWLALVSRHDAEPTADATAGVRTVFRAVGPEYFQATGTRLIRGRAIAPEDRPESPMVAVVNEAFAHRLFPEQDPIGKIVDFTGRPAVAVGRGTATIVGVVDNIKEIAMNEVGMPDIYLPFAQRPFSVVELLVRADSSDPALPGALRAAIADPFVPVTAVTALSSRVESALRPDRFNLIVVAGFATLALLMSAIGIYGAMAYDASARRREFGVRLALGATPRSLIESMLWYSARLAAAAAALGLVGAIVFARLLGDALYLVPGSHNGLLFNVTTTDPVALGCAVVGVIALAVIAGAVPASRAGRINPVTALRAE